MKDIYRVVARYKQLSKAERAGTLTEQEREEFDRVKAAFATALADDARDEAQGVELQANIDMSVTFRDSFEMQGAWLRNVRGGGLYVETDRKLPVGDEFPLTIQVTDPPTKLAVRVAVVWVNSHPGPDTSRKPGVGVKFVKPTPEQATAIERLVQRPPTAPAQEKLKKT